MEVDFLKKYNYASHPKFALNIVFSLFPTCTPTSHPTTDMWFILFPSPFFWTTVYSRKPLFFPLIHLANLYVFFTTPIQGLLSQLPSHEFYKQILSQHLSSLFVMDLYSRSHSSLCMLQSKVCIFCSESVSFTPFLAHQGSGTFLFHMLAEVSSGQLCTRHREMSRNGQEPLVPGK